MGLDMYLYKKTDSVIDNDEPENIEDGDEIYYWRKANMIHNWFLRNGELDEDFNCNTPPLIIDKELAKSFCLNWLLQTVITIKPKNCFQLQVDFSGVVLYMMNGITIH